MQWLDYACMIHVSGVVMLCCLLPCSMYMYILSIFVYRYMNVHAITVVQYVACLDGCECLCR